MATAHFYAILFWICTASIIAAAYTPASSFAQAPNEPTTITVEMVDRGGGQWRFVPEEITVKRGYVVRFIQKDVVPHNVEFKDVPSGTNLGDSMMGPWLMAKGEVYDVAIDERFAEGIHEYICTPHAPMGMKGKIKVEQSLGASN